MGRGRRRAGPWSWRGAAMGRTRAAAQDEQGRALARGVAAAWCVVVEAKGEDLTPPLILSLASPHRPLASDGSLESRRREYL